MEQDVGPEQPADAAAAFDALRREVALLNVAIAGLAAERAPAPDYSETLGEIAKGVSVAVGRLATMATSPALAMSPAEMARRIAASDEARRLDHAAVHQAQEALLRSARDLDGWIDRARLASLQNWRLVQVGGVGVVCGAVLYAGVSTVIVNAAPPHWAWPEKRAARVLRRDMGAAGERLLSMAVPDHWEAIEKCLEAEEPQQALADAAPGRQSRIDQDEQRVKRTKN